MYPDVESSIDSALSEDVFAESSSKKKASTATKRNPRISSEKKQMAQSVQQMARASSSRNTMLAGYMKTKELTDAETALQQATKAWRDARRAYNEYKAEEDDYDPVEEEEFKNDITTSKESKDYWKEKIDELKKAIVASSKKSPPPADENTLNSSTTTGTTATATHLQDSNNNSGSDWLIDGAPLSNKQDDWFDLFESTVKASLEAFDMQRILKSERFTRWKHGAIECSDFCLLQIFESRDNTSRPHDKSIRTHTNWKPVATLYFFGINSYLSRLTPTLAF